MSLACFYGCHDTRNVVVDTNSEFPRFSIPNLDTTVKNKNKTIDNHVLQHTLLYYRLHTGFCKEVKQVIIPSLLSVILL